MGENIEEFYVEITSTGGICQISPLNFKRPCASYKDAGRIFVMIHRLQFGYKKIIFMYAYNTAVAASPSFYPPSERIPA